MVVVEGGRGVAWWGDEAEAGGTTQQTGEAKGEASSSKGSCCLCPQRQTPDDAETMGTTSRLWLGRLGQRWQWWRRKRTRRVCEWLVGGRVDVDVGVVVLVFFVEGLWAGVSPSPSLAH